GKGDFVENSGILVIDNQALPNGAVGITNVEPDAVSSIAQKTAALEHSIAAQHEVVPARFPATIKIFRIVVSDHAFGEEQSMSAAGSKAQLSVVPKRAAPHDGIFSFKRRSAGIQRLEHAIFHRVEAAC